VSIDVSIDVATTHTHDIKKWVLLISKIEWKPLSEDQREERLTTFTYSVAPTWRSERVSE